MSHDVVRTNGARVRYFVASMPCLMKWCSLIVGLGCMPIRVFPRQVIGSNIVSLSYVRNKFLHYIKFI